MRKVKVKVCSDKSPFFVCPKCNYKEARLVKGDISMSPCTNCGYSKMYRVGTNGY